MENWKDIKDYKGYYQVSDLGRVRSLDRTVIYKKNGGIHEYKGKLRKLCLSVNGYYVINLNKKGIKETKSVHRLVLETFTGEYYKSHNEKVADHIDNNPLNNKLDNLQWITQRHNSTKDKKGDLPTGVVYITGNYKNHFRSEIYIGNKTKYLGYFSTPEEASLIYQKELTKLMKC